MELTGTRVVLRPVQPDDLAKLARLFDEPEVSRWWVGYDRDRVRREFVDDDDDPTATRYVVAVDGQVAGVIQTFEEPDPEYRSAAIDIAISTEWHGTGVAVDALRTLARDLIDRRGHHHLTIDPAAANARAIACYAKVGFRPVGVLRQNERGADGTFHDALLMDLLAGELR
jgi:aminoglycoside 6'-N-acetyltransferase